MIQNETIRINIDIDDRDIRNLNDSFSELQNSIQDLRESLSHAVENISDMKKEMTTLERLTKLSSDAFKTFETGLKLTVAPLYMINNHLEDLDTALNTTTLGAKAMQGALNLKTIAAWGSVAALKAMKFAMKALPIIGLVTMALSLISVLGRIFSSTNDASDATDDFTERLQRLKNELADNQDAHESNIRRIGAHNQTMRDLIITIANLNHRTNLSAEEYNQLRIATNLLNEATGGYTLTIDEATGRLDANGTSVLLNIMNYHNLAAATEKVEENLDRLLELYNTKNYATERVETLTAAYNELDAQLGIYRDQLEPLQDELAEINLNFQRYVDTSDEAIERHAELSAEIYELENSMSSMGDELTEISNGIVTYSKILNDAEYNIESLEATLIESYQNMDDATRNYLAIQRLSWDSLNEHQQSIMTDLKNGITDYTSHAQNRMTTLSDEVTVTGRDMINNMIENQRVLETWADNIAILAYRGIDEGLLDELRRAGPEGAAQVAAMIAMCDVEFAEMNEVYARGAQVAVDAMATQLGEGFDHAVDMASHFVHDARTTMVDEIKSADFESIGKAIPEGAAQGIARDIDAIKATEGLVESICGAFIRNMDINSPSGVFKGYGKNIIQGLVVGINDLHERPVTRLQTLAKSMQRVYNSASRDYTNIGQNIINGLNQGLLNRESTVMATARRIADNIARTMREALEINSPSRVMREQIGRHIPTGVAAGIEKYAGVAIDSIDKLASDMVKITIPSVESMIGMRPSLSFAGAGGMGSSQNNRTVNHNYDRLFEGAHIHWHNEADIRRTMEKMALVAEEDTARMW